MRNEHGWCAKCFADLGEVDDVLARPEVWCPQCGQAIEHGDDWHSDEGIKVVREQVAHEWTAAMRDGLIR